ncbi:hypothetical protein AB0B28_12840 [Glycomyces sp. NPDC046736]|uniref:hypothetical protein n=1 Tax=Glycomyces sp. NPDC046736 TaxID=3155615 RepID=UPI0033EAE024
MSSPDPLPAAIDQLYAAFVFLPRPTTIDWCHHCRSESDVAALLKPTPLREISAQALRPYAAHVLTTIGDVADFRYFLPRILEIASTTGFPWPDLDLLTDRLHLASWSTWDVEETTAIQALFRALWAKTLATYPSDPDAFTILNAIGNIRIDPAPYLHEWTASLMRPSAAAALLDMLRHSPLPLKRTERSTDPRLHDHEAQIARWVTSPKLRTTVAETFATANTEVLLQTLADIDEELTWYPSPESYTQR